MVRICENRVADLLEEESNSEREIDCKIDKKKVIY